MCSGSTWKLQITSLRNVLGYFSTALEKVATHASIFSLVLVFDTLIQVLLKLMKLNNFRGDLDSQVVLGVANVHVDAVLL